MALLSEAHGLVTDLLLDAATMPPHLASGLKALANLLSPSLPPVHHHVNTSGGSHRLRHALPHAALSDVHYASDTEEIPYTGEAPLNLSKVLENYSFVVPHQAVVSLVWFGLIWFGFSLSTPWPAPAQNISINTFKGQISVASFGSIPIPIQRPDQLGFIVNQQNEIELIMV